MKKTSLRDTVLDQFGNFLLNINFNINNDKTQILREELVDVANQLSDYYEEGNHLYPEVILLDDFDYFKASIPCFYHIFYVGIIEKKSLLHAIKMCAPLANNGWNIFIELKEDKVRWGVVNSEQSVTNVSMYNLIVGDKQMEHPIVYIRNIGFKTVEFVSRQSTDKYVISLSLRDLDDILKNETSSLCTIITMDCQNNKDDFCSFLEKIINTGIQQGHGNLLVVLKEDDGVCPQIPDILKEGVTLSSPLDFYQCFCNVRESGRDIITHFELQKNADLIMSMMNHDGIMVFSTKGKILGYHYIVENNIKTTEKIIGGARTKAYQKLCKSVTKGFIYAVFMRTQEGTVKFEKQ